MTLSACSDLRDANGPPLLPLRVLVALIFVLDTFADRNCDSKHSILLQCAVQHLARELLLRTAQCCTLFTGEGKALRDFLTVVFLVIGDNNGHSKCC